MPEKGSPKARPLDDCHALILGGTSGVGLATALRLARAGALGIALCGRNEERGNQAAARVAEFGTTVTFIPGDAREPEDVLRSVEAAREFLGRLDIAVSAVAPAGRVAPIEASQPQQLIRTLNDLAGPPILLTQAVVPHLKAAGGGAVISVASDAAKIPTPGEAVVGAGMAAIAMFGRSAALELKRHGIRVNVLSPSLISGTRTTEALFAHDMGSKIFSAIAAKAHLGVPTADDVAALVEFLASPEAAKITGQVISVNGGVSAG